MALVFIGAVADFAEPVEEYGAAERILLLTLVESDVAATTQFGVLQPLERKECPFQFAEFTQRERQAILPRIGRELTRGRINARELWEQMNTCSCLTLILACIVYWQAREISRVLSQSDPAAWNMSARSSGTTSCSTANTFSIGSLSDDAGGPLWPSLSV